MIMGCKPGATGQTSNNSEAGVDQNANFESENTEMFKKSLVKVDDLLTTVDWIGKSEKEIEPYIVDKSTNNKDSYYDIEGKFLEAKASGVLAFSKEDEKGERLVERLTITVKNSSLVDMYEKLIDIYGGPLNHGEEPYAKANGGAVDWYSFDAGRALLVISQGSEVNYCNVEIKKNPNPTSSEKLVIRKEQESELTTLPLEMIVKATEYNNGILTLEITNQTGEEISYSDDFILAKSSDNGQTYAHMTKLVSMDLINEEPSEYQIADCKTQKMTCDLRRFGKIEAGMYMIILDDFRCEFQLIPESQDNGEAAEKPWFCQECGTKNRDTDICSGCGNKKE